ncbi:hypothetical protein HGA91_00170 [candidate division WWE3 bacterium]|nr:hypothetical protein [candidate division WWE3 bacterium]
MSTHDPEQRAPFLVLVFPGDRVPTVQEIYALVSEKDRWRRVLIIEVRDHAEAVAQYLAHPTPQDIFLSMAAPTATVEYFLGFEYVPTAGVRDEGELPARIIPDSYNTAWGDLAGAMEFLLHHLCDRQVHPTSVLLGFIARCAGHEDSMSLDQLAGLMKFLQVTPEQLRKVAAQLAMMKHADRLLWWIEKPHIEVYYDPKASRGQLCGAMRARLNTNPRMHGIGRTNADAIADFLKTAVSHGLSGEIGDYIVVKVEK